MSNWFKKSGKIKKIALNPGQARYRATFPVDVFIDSTGDPEADKETVYNILLNALNSSPNIQSDHLYLSDIKLYSDVMREEGFGF